MPVTMNYCISPTFIALTVRNFNDFKTRELKRPWEIISARNHPCGLNDESFGERLRQTRFSSYGTCLHVAGTDPVIWQKIVSHVPSSPRQNGRLTRIATIHPNSRTSREGGNPTKTRTGTPRPSAANYDSRLRSWWWSSEVRWRRCRCGWC